MAALKRSRRLLPNEGAQSGSSFGSLASTTFSFFLLFFSLSLEKHTAHGRTRVSSVDGSNKLLDELWEKTMSVSD
jgi:hypothetical protein